MGQNIFHCFEKLIVGQSEDFARVTVNVYERQEKYRPSTILTETPKTSMVTVTKVTLLKSATGVWSSKL